MYKKLTISRRKITSSLLTLLLYFGWLILYAYYSARKEVSNVEVTLWSWVGIIFCVYYVLRWKVLTGKYFTPYTIFLLFFILFNFGQCILWAFGIHTENEIGQQLIFHRVSCDNQLIVLAQLMVLISLVTLNFGAMLVFSDVDKKRIADMYIESEDGTNDRKYRYLYYAALLISVFSIPATLYRAVKRFILGQQYSYHDLYYGSIAASVSSTLENVLATMFLPCLLGLLIGSHYKKNVRTVVYSIFFVFAVFTMLCGDRGEWINMLLILFWADCTFQKRKSFKKLIPLGIVAFFGLYVIEAISSLRNIGLSWSGFMNALVHSENNPIIEMLMEFGNSMGISIIVIKDELVSPYGNTFFMSIPTTFSTGLGNRLFGLDYVQLHTWFPMEYLKIDVGTDFSMIGESILNFGVYATPFVILLEGMIISKISTAPYYVRENPLMTCIALAALATITKLPRSTIWLVLNGVIYVVITFFIVYKLVEIISNSIALTTKNKARNKQ